MVATACIRGTTRAPRRRRGAAAIVWAGGALLALLAVPAIARPAKCFTTDDGHYACDFKALDKAGSFRISAPGKPTFTLEAERPGVMAGYGDFGTGRNVPLPGEFVRSREDGACWDNTDTGTRICAW